MKLYLFPLFFLSTFCFAQETAIPNQFWNNYAHVNAAMAGTEFKHTAGLSYQSLLANLSNSTSNFFGFYNTRIKEHHGLGAEVFTGLTENSNAQQSYVTLMYNYQFKLKKKNQRITLGVAPTFGQIAFEDVTTSPDTAFNTGTPIAGRTDDLLTHAGISYTSDFCQAGFSIRNLPVVNLTQPGNGTFNYMPSFYGHLSLKAALGARSKASNKHALYLDGMYSYTNGFQHLQADVRIFLWEKLTAMAGYISSNSFVCGVGWDLKKKFRGMYTWQLSRSKLNGNSASTHEVGLIYMLKHEN